MSLLRALAFSLLLGSALQAHAGDDTIFGGHTAGFEAKYFVPATDAEAARFLNALRLVKLAVSLGGTESLAEHPGTMTHADVPPDAQLRMGITPGLVRLSIGVEHYEDLLADVAQALDAV